MQMLVALRDRLDGLAQREKILVSAAVAAVLGMALQFALLDVLLAEQDRALGQLQSTQQTGARLDEQIAQAEKSGVTEKHNRLVAESDALAGLVRGLDAEIEAHAATLIAPEVMTSVLQKVLGDYDLTLLEMSNESPTALLQLAPADAGEHAEGVHNLYRHGLVLKLRGRFVDAVRYLQQVEALPWRFLWEEMSYEVEVYPEAVIELRLQTLSTDTGWFGV